MTVCASGELSTDGAEGSAGSEVCAFVLADAGFGAPTRYECCGCCAGRGALGEVQLMVRAVGSGAGPAGGFFVAPLGRATGAAAADHLALGDVVFFWIAGVVDLVPAVVDVFLPARLVALLALALAVYHDWLRCGRSLHDDALWLGLLVSNHQRGRYRFWSSVVLSLAGDEIVARPAAALNDAHILLSLPALFALPRPEGLFAFPLPLALIDQCAATRRLVPPVVGFALALVVVGARWLLEALDARVVRDLDARALVVGLRGWRACDAVSMHGCFVGALVVGVVVVAVARLAGTHDLRHGCSRCKCEMSAL